MISLKRLKHACHPGCGLVVVLYKSGRKSLNNFIVLYVVLGLWVLDDWSVF